MVTVEDILMSKGPDVIVSSRKTTVYEAARLMVEANTGSVVIKDGDVVEGIFTERDLLRRVVATQKDPAETLLGDVMTESVLSVGLSLDARDCLSLMQQHHIRHLAVMEDGALIGMISIRDVLTAEFREDEEIIHDLQDQEDQS